MSSGVEDLGPKHGPSPTVLMLDSADAIPVDSLTEPLEFPRRSASAASSAAPKLSLERQREAELVARAQAGDERALRSIYDSHEHQVRGHLYRLLGSDSEIDDMVQVVFSRAFAAIDRFEGNSALSTWLYRITVNSTHNLVRQRFRRNRMQHALRRFEIGRDGGKVQPDKLEARDEAKRILERLEPRLRQVFVLYHYEGLTLQEIGTILERPVSTVGDRLTRARKRLRELVREA